MIPERWTGAWWVLALAAGLGLAGCLGPAPLCTEPPDPTPGIPADVAETPYVDTGDPYALGPLQVRTLEVPQCADGAPTALRIHAPAAAGLYPLVVFQHGFQSRNAAYDQILGHVASHGFVVVAPQMYEPGLAALLGSPTAAEEAQSALRVLDWLPAHVSELTGVQVRSDVLGLAGHSRGGKVAWLVLSADPTRAQAWAGVDPVDGTGGPLGHQARAVQGAAPFDVPTLVLGTGLGGGCAPAGDNHEQFYAAARSPSWHLVALQQGHGDMLDEDDAAAAALLCTSGPDRPGMRRLTAGVLVTLFRGTLQGDAGALEALTDVAAMPIRVAAESK
jgi:chlorophyllase